MSASTEKIRERILLLVESEFESDAAFERELGLKSKTVSNWRRGKSASFMSILPALSARFGVSASELLDIPLKGESSELSDDEIKLLTLYRRSRALPKKMRHALRETLEATINMYLAASESGKKKK